MGILSQVGSETHGITGCSILRENGGKDRKQ